MFDDDDQPGSGLWSREPVTLPRLAFQHDLGGDPPPSGHVRYASLPVPLLAPLPSGRSKRAEYLAKWRAANRERIRERAREADRRYRERNRNNPEFRAKAVARQRRYQQRLKESGRTGYASAQLSGKAAPIIS
jgi:hypothetical protein